MYQKNLEYLGLSEKEARLYYALLKIETASAVSLSRRTGLKQPTVYVVIDQLVKKGLAREVVVGKRTHFSAESPENLKLLVEKEKSQIENKIKKTESIIAELKAVDRESGERPKVRFYEGKESLKQSVEEYVAETEFSEGMDYGIYAYDILPEIFSKKDLETIEEKRIENNINFRAIYSGVGKVINPTNKLQELIK
jgi:sugar-specific transcriptional regulator TrmB